MVVEHESSYSMEQTSAASKSVNCTDKPTTSHETSNSQHQNDTVHNSTASNTNSSNLNENDEQTMKDREKESTKSNNDTEMITTTTTSTSTSATITAQSANLTANKLVHNIPIPAPKEPLITSTVEDINKYYRPELVSRITSCLGVVEVGFFFILN